MEKGNCRSCGAAGGGLLKTVFLPFGLYFALQLLCVGSVVFAGGKDGDDSVRLSAASACADVALIAAYLFLVRRNEKRGFSRPDQSRSLRPRAALCAFLGFLSSYLLLNVLLTSAGLADADKSFQNSAETIQALPGALRVALVCVLAPLTEELLFRGLLLQGLERFFGAGAAVFLSALTFAVFHGNLTQGTAALATGCVLGAAYVRTRALALPVLMHAGSNALALLLTESGYTGEGLEGPRLLILAGTAFLSFWEFLRTTRREKENAS